MHNGILKDRIFWLLLVFASIYILGNIGAGSLSTFDEAVYANISRNILKTGDWLVMRQGVKPWFDKPPLYMWCTAVFYKIFGVSEFSTRLTSGIFGIATVMVLYLFAKKMKDQITAVLAALMLLALPHYIHFCKSGMMDVPTTFFTTLMLYFFWLGLEKETFLFYSGAMLGISYLMKGFAAFLAPLIILAYAVLSGNIRLVFKRQFVAGIVAALAIIFFWHLTQLLLAGPAALKQYFGFHIYERATSALEGHRGGIDYYIRALFKKNLPWSLILYASVFYIAWQFIKSRDSATVLIFSWILITYILYALVKTKLHWYIMPIYPALALSSAFLLSRFLEGKVLYGSIAVILLGMVMQVPLSWAFRLDYTPDIKKVSIISKELCMKGDDVYMIGGNDSEIFYYDFTKPLDRETYKSLIAQGKRSVYCIMLPDMFEQKREEYNFCSIPIYESKRTSLYRIMFKDRK